MKDYDRTWHRSPTALPILPQDPHGMVDFHAIISNNALFPPIRDFKPFPLPPARNVKKAPLLVSSEGVSSRGELYQV
jgi:hypothetical protein